jgi:type III restriction enzyme
MSYVFTASNRFADTLQSIVKGLNRAGFSNKDHRVFDPASSNEIIEPEKSQPVMDDLFFQAEESRPEPTLTNNKQADFDTAKINASLLMPTSHDKTHTATGNRFVDVMTQQAIQQNKAYEQQAKSTTENVLPEELESKMNKHRMKDIFMTDLQDFHLPQFFIKVEDGGWLDSETELLERDLLLRDLKLVNLDATISFEDVKSEVYRVDLEEIGQEDYIPTPLKIDSKRRQQFNEIILSQSPESQKQSIQARLLQHIGNLDPIDHSDAKQYLNRIISNLNKEQIRDCLERDVAYARKIKNKIDELANTHAYKQFIDLLDIEKIVLQPGFTLPENITPKANASVITKSLYVTEAYMGNFEHRVISDIANLDNVLWWHRNLSRGKGFRINGYLNHYPDFIIKTKSGRVIVLETKGDDRDNSDSELKLKLGKKWESAAGSMFKYMMVFDTNPIDGAEKITSALSKINQL